MGGVRRVARSILKWFSALYVVAIIVQVFLAGEGIFGLNNIKHADDCNKAAAQCIANSKTLDAHRGLGFFLTMPGALLFLIVALLAWHPNKRIRIVSIVAPIRSTITNWSNWPAMMREPPLRVWMNVSMKVWL